MTTAQQKAAEEEETREQDRYKERCKEAHAFLSTFEKGGTFLWPEDVHGMVQISPDDFFSFVEAVAHAFLEATQGEL